VEHRRSKEQFVEKPYGSCQFPKSRKEWDDNIKIHLSEIGYKNRS
jgi:hypothetical protein